MSLKKTVVYALAAASTLLYSCNKQEKSGYLVTQEVFDKFKGTEEVRTKLGSLQEKQKSILDSLRLEINALEAKGKGKDEIVNNKKQTYSRLLTEFSQSNQEQQDQYTEGLWKQINQYVSEYGKQHSYKYIYGADGSGTIMYADSTLNITSKIVEYMNSKYEGK